ncbi:MAG: Hsp20/alpha crystallin family protein [Acidobacteria bacterium]|nr:MAG: Hsp20/alpha crystallin family protein [Acidobacteriota bacterium]
MAGMHLAVRSEEHPAPFKVTEFDNIFQCMQEMHEMISHRAFELFEEGGRIFGRDLSDWFKAESELLHPVNVSIDETEEGLRVEAEVPGFKAKELEASVEPHRLTITGKREIEKEEKKGKTIYSERNAERILRIINLPAEVNTETVSATLKDGVLVFMLSKAAPAKKIAIEGKAA